MKTEAYGRPRTRRKRIETLFGDAPQLLALTRIRLRALLGAKDEFLLASTVQNLKRLVKLAATPPATADNRLKNSPKFRNLRRQIKNPSRHQAKAEEKCPSLLYLRHVIRDYLRRCGGIGMAKKPYSYKDVLNLLR